MIVLLITTVTYFRIDGKRYKLEDARYLEEQMLDESDNEKLNETDNEGMGGNNDESCLQEESEAESENVIVEEDILENDMEETEGSTKVEENDLSTSAGNAITG